MLTAKIGVLHARVVYHFVSSCPVCLWNICRFLVHDSFGNMLLSTSRQLSTFPEKSHSNQGTRVLLDILFNLVHRLKVLWWFPLGLKWRRVWRDLNKLSHFDIFIVLEKLPCSSYDISLYLSCKTDEASAQSYF